MSKSNCDNLKKNDNVSKSATCLNRNSLVDECNMSNSLSSFSSLNSSSFEKKSNCKKEKKELKNIKKNQYIASRYGKDKNGERTFTEPIHVLAKDEEAFLELCEKYKPDDKTMTVMRQNEYDSKINLSKEIINSNTLCQQ